VTDETFFVKEEAFPGRDDPLFFVNLAFAVEALVLIVLNGPVTTNFLLQPVAYVINMLQL
jgi:hypothetical protein